jgi:hypothetical protein
MKWIFIGLIILVVCSVGSELALRWIFGFGKPLLYLGDENIGYLLAPNQRVKRLGNRIQVNQFSMRNDSIEPERSLHTLRILMVGDSIINGGWWTDQSKILSEGLRASLSQSLSQSSSSNSSQGVTIAQAPPWQTVEVLNASANSWGPRNELAYLQRFGLFQAQVLILVINTDDLFGLAPSSLGVGRELNYPDRYPPSALTEVWQRYIY